MALPLCSMHESSRQKKNSENPEKGKSLKGIMISENEVKISQYTNDTSHSLEGSNESLFSALHHDELCPPKHLFKLGKDGSVIHLATINCEKRSQFRAHSTLKVMRMKFWGSRYNVKPS